MTQKTNHVPAVQTCEHCDDAYTADGSVRWRKGGRLHRRCAYAVLYGAGRAVEHGMHDGAK